MNVYEIRVGGRYYGRNGSIREVIGAGPEFKLYDSQADDDCLRWRLVKHGSRKVAPLGTEGNCTLTSFARWAMKAADGALTGERSVRR